METKGFKTLEETAILLKVKDKDAVLDLIVVGKLEVSAYRSDDHEFQKINSIAVKKAILTRSRVPLMFHIGDKEGDPALPTTSISQLRVSESEIERYLLAASPFTNGFALDRANKTVRLGSNCWKLTENRFKVLVVMVEAAERGKFEMKEIEIRQLADLNVSSTLYRIFQGAKNVPTPEWEHLFEKVADATYRLKFLKAKPNE